MKQQKIARLLEAFTFLTMIITALFCFWIIPEGMNMAIENFPELESMHFIGYICSFILFLLCCGALINFKKICHNIGLGNSFCKNNAKHMKIITNIALSLFIFFIICFIILYVNHFVSGPLIVWGIFIEFFVSGITILCYALTQLIENACDIQEENNLTI